MLPNPQIHRVLVALLLMTLKAIKFACGTHLIRYSIKRPGARRERGRDAHSMYAFVCV